jgi:putative DNA-invertase from lambdoid prophage Rac
MMAYLLTHSLTMTHLAYYRVSTTDQSTASQRASLLKATGRTAFDKEFFDEGVSGAVPAAQRPAFAAFLGYVREGDTLHVSALDRLGRDALDVQATIRALLLKGVTVDVQGLGPISRGVGEIVVAVLAQVADLERNRIIERTAAGREVAKEALRTTGKTHHGKDSMGRPPKGDEAAVRAWRATNSASIAVTAKHFGLSVSTVKRYCAQD